MDEDSVRPVCVYLYTAKFINIYVLNVNMVKWFALLARREHDKSYRKTYQAIKKTIVPRT